METKFHHATMSTKAVRISIDGVFRTFNLTTDEMNRLLNGELCNRIIFCVYLYFIVNKILYFLCYNVFLNRQKFCCAVSGKIQKQCRGC